ncbi:MAG: type II secretion system protein [Candidatus Peregrinibacteria bacterium]
MRRKIRQQKGLPGDRRGFTLIELLIAMSIFITFVGVLIGSYTSIVQSQREANNYRMMYSEARRVFDKLTAEIRSGEIYYPGQSGGLRYAGSSDRLDLVSMDGDRVVSFVYDSESGRILFLEKIVADTTGYFLNSGMSSGGANVSEFSVFVSPAGDPYAEENIYADSLQFQPKVTVYAEFEGKKLNSGDPYMIDMQTTVSSRLYTASPGLAGVGNLPDPDSYFVNSSE